MNKITLLYTGCLATLMGINFLSYSAAESFRPTQEDRYDLILAVPQNNIDIVFYNLQGQLTQALIRQFGAAQSPSDPSFYTINRLQLNFTTNFLPGVPMRPHISLKGIPLSRRQDAEMVFNSDLFAGLQIPNSIRLTNLLAIRGSEKPGVPDKLFIVADFQDSLGDGFDQIARQLDEISGIDRPSHAREYLHHITIAKMMPFKRGSQKISDRTVQDVQELLDQVWKTVTGTPAYNQNFPIDRIEYSYWQEDPHSERRTRPLWPTAIAHYPPRQPELTPPLRETPEEVISAALETQRRQLEEEPERRPVYTYDQAGPTILSNHYRGDLFWFKIRGDTSAAGMYDYYEREFNNSAQRQFGRNLTDRERNDLMKDVLRAKYENDPYRTALLQTSDAQIVNNSRNPYWGYPGQDWLGRILMEVRDELRGILTVVPAARRTGDVAYQAGPPMKPVLQQTRERRETIPPAIISPRPRVPRFPMARVPERFPVARVPEQPISMIHEQLIQRPPTIQAQEPIMPPARVPIKPLPPLPAPAVQQQIAVPQPAEQQFPLHAAIKADDCQKVAALLGQHENVNRSDLLGDTPLHLAVDIDNMDIVKMLLVNGADVLALDANKHTPFVRAHLKGNYRIADFINDWKVECPICMEQIELMKMRAVGRCGHRVCAKCLEDLYKRRGELQTGCPTCRGPAYPPQQKPE